MTLSVIDQHIEATPGICAGKPRIVGHRITVEQVAFWHEKLGLRPDEIACQYDLTLADVHAALAYYHDHREAIDQQAEARAAFTQTLRQQTPSALAAKQRPQAGG